MYIEFPWAKDYPVVLNELKTSQKGLMANEAESRLKSLGQNILKGKDKNSLLGIFIKQFYSPLIFILIGAAVLTGVLNEWLNMSVIIFAVLVNVFLGFYREYHAENTLAKLTSYIKQRSIVLRDDIEQEVDAADIVVGDILVLNYGSRIPADGLILNLNNFKVDEAILTGESVPVEKKAGGIDGSSIVSERKNMVHAGTMVVEGTAIAVVTSTGTNTEIGKIAGLVSSVDQTPTPIQKGLAKLAWLIFAVVIFIIIGIFILGVSRGESVLDMLILSAAVSVGAVPESLPIALTVILSIGAERIAKKKGIVRKLAAAETLGSTTLILTDKTGTLTQANMELVNIFTKQEILNKDYQLFEKAEKYFNTKLDVLRKAFKNINVAIENPKDTPDKWLFRGRPIEVHIAKSMQVFSVQDLVDFRNLKNQIILPFDSRYKFSVSYEKDANIIMGAPDILASMSNLTKDEYITIIDFINKSSEEGKRLVAICTTNSSKEFDLENPGKVDFIGIIAFKDPLRPEVKDSIKKIENLGQKVAIVTGDLKGTAIAIAKEIGWDVKENEVLTGVDIKSMTDEDLKKIIQDIKIFARVTPEDKLRIGTLYQSLGEIVAMTGDGVNDSPALKAMDIGVSLGSGSDVAKSASDIVLLDDNFKTIATAITEGRKILSNIRKSFMYLMSNSLDEVFVVGGSLIAGVVMPLNALQIIWVNLFTGSLPAIAFAYEEQDVGEKEIFSKNIFSKEVNIITFGIGILSSALLFVLHLLLLNSGIETGVARTIFFICFSSYILVVAFSFKNLHKNIFQYNLLSNKKLNQSILVATIILVFTISSPFMRNIFDLDKMQIIYLPIVVLWLIVNILLVEIAKWFLRKSLVKKNVLK